MKTRLLLLAILLVLTAAVVCVSILLTPPAQVVEPVMPAELPEGMPRRTISPSGRFSRKARQSMRRGIR